MDTETPLFAPDAERKKAKRLLLSILGIMLIGFAIASIARFSLTYERITSGESDLLIKEFADEALVPHKDPNRINVLLLGIRGEGDAEGGLLTDTMLVASIEKSTGKAALLSIPRDLWVRMPGRRESNKINEAYALGYVEDGQSAALQYAEVVATRVTGLAFDGVASVDLRAVKELIDALGGLTVTLRQPFIEDRQWVRGGDMGTSSMFVIWKDTATSSEVIAHEDGTTSVGEVVHESERWVFNLPRGTHVLNGTTALYYLRARYASSDFDRARRQQEALIGMRDKLKSLGILLNPLKINELLRVAERHITTDISLSQLAELAGLAARIDVSALTHTVLDASEGGYLTARRNEQGLYILEPRDGGFSAIRKAARDVFAPNSTP